MKEKSYNEQEICWFLQDVLFYRKLSESEISRLEIPIFAKSLDADEVAHI